MTFKSSLMTFKIFLKEKFKCPLFRCRFFAFYIHQPFIHLAPIFNIYKFIYLANLFFLLAGAIIQWWYLGVMVLDLEVVKAEAQRRGYTIVRIHDLNKQLQLRRVGEQVNVWWSTATVGTYLDHPRQGKTQLFRRNCSLVELREILDNPRKHTGKGCRNYRILV